MAVLGGTEHQNNNENGLKNVTHYINIHNPGRVGKKNVVRWDANKSKSKSSK